MHSLFQSLRAPLRVASEGEYTVLLCKVHGYAYVVGTMNIKIIQSYSICNYVATKWSLQQNDVFG